MWLGWDTVTRDRLEQIETDDFERLIAALVRLEATDRWGTAYQVVERSADGPDGGLDVLVTFPAPGAGVGARRLPRAYTLMPCAAQAPSLAISCKSGPNALKSQRAEADKQSRRVVDVLAAGGHLVLVTHVAATRLTKATARSAHDTCRAALAEAYAKRTELKALGASVLFDRVHLIDGDDLVQLLKAWRPHELSILEADLAQRLGLRSVSELRSADAWQQAQTLERGAPGFRDDDARAALRGRLGAWIVNPSDDATQQARVLHGAPGVGKTRLVLETLAACGASARAVVSDDPAALREAIQDEGLLAHCPRAVLVLDDCPASRAEGVLVAFQRALADTPDAHARLLVVVPEAAQPDTRERAPRVLLEALHRLSPEASRALVQEEMGADHPGVDRVARLTEGYPRFAVLVAREVRGGAPLPHSTTDAARYALAANDERSPQCVADRARALVGVTLVRRRVWRELDDATRDAVANAIGLRDRKDWDDQLRACLRRGLLRDGHRWYVTPGILVREAWRIVHAPDDPGPPLGPRILRACPDLLDNLLEHLRDVGIADDEFAALARSLLEHLRTTAPRLDALPAQGLSTALLLAAQHAPEALLDALEGWLSPADEASCAQAARARRAFTLALRALPRLGSDFDRVERLLFALALHDTDTHIGNARDAWAWLFLAWLDTTGVPFSDRLPTLHSRCEEGAPEARAFAVSQLERLVMPDALVMGAGNPHPVGTVEIAQGLDACWALLLDRVHDPDPAVRAAASHAVVARVADRLRSPGLNAHADKLLAAVSSLPVALQRALRERLQHERVAEVHQALRDRVLRETAPQDYAARLRELARDFRHTPEALLGHPLLREGLDPETLPLAGCLSVLRAPESRAAAAVMQAVGRLDADARLRDALVEDTRRSGDARLIAAWSLGQRDGAWGDRVRAMVEAWSSAADEALDLAALRIAVVWGLDDAWAPLTLTLLRRRVHHPDTTRLLNLGDWRALSARWRLTLSRALLDLSPSEGAPVVVAKLADTGLALDPAEQATLAEAMRRFTPAQLRGHDAWAFHQAGLRLLDTPQAAAVCTRAVQWVADDPTHIDRALWLLVADAAERAPALVWSALSGALGRPNPGLSTAVALYPIVKRLPVDAMMAWVGDDARRAMRLAEMLRFEGDALPALAAAMLERFGADAPVADGLAERLTERPRMVEQHPVDFLSERLAACRGWTADPRPAVSRWAATQSAAIERALRHAAGEAALRSTGS